MQQYYGIGAFFFGAFMGICIMFPFIKKNNTCLHCGKENANYCEKCYQDLIALNMGVQVDKKSINYMQMF